MRAAASWAWVHSSLRGLHSALYCTVLYCTVLYRTVLYCTVLYCTVLCTVQVNFTLDYTPKFVKKPIVWEKKASLLSNARQRQLPSREKRGIFRVNRALSTLLSPDCTGWCFRGPPPRSGPRPSPSSPSRSCGTLATSTSPSAWTGDLALALAS